MKFTEDTLFIAPTPIKLAEELAGWFLTKVFECSSREKPFHVAISGGSTPILFFTQLASNYGKYIDWNRVHFYWVDEKASSKPGNENNYLCAYNNLLSKIAIPETNIHPIKFENDLARTAKMYSINIQENVPIIDDIPQFDLVILGIGYDGHTASVFPGQDDLIYSGNYVEVSENPENNEKRITLTPYLINNAAYIAFHATGMAKAQMIKEIVSKSNSENNYPASHIKPIKGSINWFIDTGAASKLFS